MKRSIKLIGLDKELLLSKVTAIKTDKQMIHLDQLKDGTWRLIYNANLIPDITKLLAMSVVRED
jgi:hypothetical protein